jgi:hypothetical protein
MTSPKLEIKFKKEYLTNLAGLLRVVFEMQRHLHHRHYHHHAMTMPADCYGLN